MITRMLNVTWIAAALAAGTALAAAPVDLGTAGNYAVLAETAITTTSGSSIVGNIGLSPAAASYITGFTMLAPPTSFTTAAEVTGKVYAADYDPPTPVNLGTAIGDMLAAFTDAAGRAPTFPTELYSGDLSGRTLAAGVYKWGTGVLINSDVTLSGNASAVWIFQIAGNLTVASGGSLPTGVHVLLAGGALASNVFWQVGGVAGADLGTYSTINGTILSAKQIVVRTGAVLNGRTLSQTQVTLDANRIVSSSGGYQGPNPPAAGKAFAYPSPANGGAVNIVYSMAEAGTSEIRIWNENGDLVALVEKKELAGPQKTQVSTKPFARGIYLFRVKLTYESGRVERISPEKFSVTQ